MTERDKMLAGEAYDPWDPDLVAARVRAQDLCWRLNGTAPSDAGRRASLLADLLGESAGNVAIQSPFFCDYGSYITFGPGCFLNYNCVLLDVCPIRVGARTLLGPGVQLLTATHPLDAVARRTRESGKPVTVGDDVWIGAGALVCPGVTIGDRAVIGAGSVVTRDVPAGVLAVGNPCRVVRSLEASP